MFWIILIGIYFIWDGFSERDNEIRNLKYRVDELENNDL